MKSVAASLINVSNCRLNSPAVCWFALIVDLLNSETNTFISSDSFLVCCHELNMQHLLLISASQKKNHVGFSPHETIFNVLFEKPFSHPLRTTLLHLRLWARCCRQEWKCWILMLLLFKDMRTHKPLFVKVVFLLMWIDRL